MPVYSLNSTVTLAYDQIGQGSPLLLIHGFMGTGLTEFPALLPQLARRYQVLAPDLRGYGKSTPKPRQYDRHFYRHDAEDLVALLAYLNLKNVIVLGYSDGGEVALWLPILAPERVKAVVTWGATGHFHPRIKPAVLSMLNMTWHTPHLNHLHGAEYIRPMTENWVQGMLKIMEDGGDITLSRAKEITCPVLMMLGDQDALNPVEQGRIMAEAIPKGQLAVFKRTGHGIHAERPYRFLWRVGQFLWRL